MEPMYNEQSTDSTISSRKDTSSGYQEEREFRLAKPQVSYQLHYNKNHPPTQQEEKEAIFAEPQVGYQLHSNNKNHPPSQQEEKEAILAKPQAGYQLQYNNNNHPPSQQEEKEAILAKPPLTYHTYKKQNKGFKGVKSVEEGLFFRQSMMTVGSIIRMQNIKDYIPRQSFFTRSILKKLPSASSEMSQLLKLFNNLSKTMMESVKVCHNPANTGEERSCEVSLKGMLDFAKFILGRNITAHTTESVNVSSQNIIVVGVNVIGEKSVTCHRSWFPFLMCYCHSVPKVCIYQVDIWEVKSKQKINNGVAVCHLDTSSWSPTHVAFKVLGYGPGLIEACHWVFENDMVWIAA
ncbi:polygalacturonase 1 beta-like protein 3 [Vicia villosa]|uniref:polygalacturonase 1 beta-like protein 3 n=1 Tax=Vicia villosa TaxID=3911 RepID=UPI00273B94AD|nr:polygalacturonase 1 beta-like protein 3 [Vicia villosa]